MNILCNFRVELGTGGIAKRHAKQPSMGVTAFDFLSKVLYTTQLQHRVSGGWGVRLQAAGSK
jgi:hypothetical protein